MYLFVMSGSYLVSGASPFGPLLLPEAEQHEAAAPEMSGLPTSSSAEAAAARTDANRASSNFARYAAALSLLAFAIGYDSRKFEGVLSLIPGFGPRGQAT